MGTLDVTEVGHAELLRAMDPRVLGGRIRAAREARGLTQQQLGGADLSAGYLSRIENGARRPALPVLQDIALRLSTSVDQLLRGMSAAAYDEIRLDLDFAEIALESGEASDAHARASSGLQRAQAASQADLALRARLLHARALESLGSLNDAILDYEKALESATGLLALQAGIALSRCYRESGDLALAIEVGERLKRVIEDADLGNTDEAVRLAVTVAAAYAERGDVARATRICADAVRRAETVSSPQARSAAYWNASILYARRGEVSDAIPLAKRALALLAEGTDERNLSRLRLTLGRLHLSAPEPDIAEAVEHITRARTDFGSSSASVVDVSLSDVSLAQAHVINGDPDAAAEIAHQAFDNAPEEASMVRAEALVILGQAEAARGRETEAKSAYQRAVHLLSAAGSDRGAAQLWLELGELLNGLGDTEAAIAAFRSATAASGLRTRAHLNTGRGVHIPSAITEVETADVSAD
ncbi:tetratricopeptide repeat protein [Nocardioides panacisoli]|uniref:helix-turn-helix domain-containing protein n=1 Tax=Nocardioides panacisoli TaxID=627624 RepID=UPI001C638F5F|nr:tetratricopeptide repeat protein [Nocardioides panacisoli]QYJ03061.1 tetratricopeptide repeat protein [Nocardioides panacisoli]